MKRWRLGASALAVLATVGVCVLFLPALRQTARPAAALSSHPIRWVLAGRMGEQYRSPAWRRAASIWTSSGGWTRF